MNVQNAFVHKELIKESMEKKVKDYLFVLSVW